MADEYVRKQDAVDAVPKNGLVEYMDEFGAGYNSSRNDTLRSIEFLKEQPADVVPVVRCKDCEHCYFGDNRVPDEQRFVCGINSSER